MADGKLQKWHKGKGQTVKWAKPVGLRILFLGDHGLGRSGQMNGTQRASLLVKAPVRSLWPRAFAMAKVTTERIRETQTIARHLEISLQNLNRTAANFANFVSIDKPKRLRLLSLKFGSTNIYLLPAPHAERPGRGYSFSPIPGT